MIYYSNMVNYDFNNLINHKEVFQKVKEDFKSYKVNYNKTFLIDVIYKLNQLFDMFLKSNIENNIKKNCIKEFNPYEFDIGEMPDYEVENIYNILLQSENEPIHTNYNQKIIKDLCNNYLNVSRVIPMINLYKYKGYDLIKIIESLINEWEKFISRSNNRIPF